MHRVIVHTNLGRSCLADEAIASVHDASRCYTNLEYNLEAGKEDQIRPC